MAQGAPGLGSCHPRCRPFDSKQKLFYLERGDSAKLTFGFRTTIAKHATSRHLGLSSPPVRAGMPKPLMP